MEDCINAIAKHYFLEKEIEQGYCFVISLKVEEIIAGNN
jgi:hypothetical protein